MPLLGHCNLQSWGPVYYQDNGVAMWLWSVCVAHGRLLRFWSGLHGVSGSRALALGVYHCGPRFNFQLQIVFVNWNDHRHMSHKTWFKTMWYDALQCNSIWQSWQSPSPQCRERATQPGRGEFLLSSLESFSITWSKWREFHFTFEKKEKNWHPLYHMIDWTWPPKLYF